MEPHLVSKRLEVSSPCLDHAPSPMAETEGATHVMRYVNPAFCGLVHKTRDEILGKPFCEILPDMDECLAPLDRIYRTGESETRRQLEGPARHSAFASYAMWPVMENEGVVGVMIQVIEAVSQHEKTRVMNEALVLGALRQHRLVEVAGLSNVRLQAELANGKQQEEQIAVLALTDPLTGLANRRRMTEVLALEVSRAERTGGQFCACILDIDNFKRINDIYGHDAGDNVLVAFSKLMRQNTRPTDVVARFGGEEFVVLLPHTDLSSALITIDRIREAFANCRVDPLPDPVTASFGVVERVAGEQGDALLRRADKALYEAKNGGRNRTVAA